jgi:hypothetical protein
MALRMSVHIWSSHWMSAFQNREMLTSAFPVGVANRCTAWR